MSKCPYTNFKQRVMDYIGMLRQPRKEYGDMPVCPFIGREVDKDKLMIEKFDPAESNLLDIIHKYEESDYDNALLVQVADDVMFARDTVRYQNFINKTLIRSDTIYDFPLRWSFNNKKQKLVLM